MTLLILGGTLDARRAVDALYAPLQQMGVDIIYSIAGLVRVPEMPCQVLVGGFRQFGGLHNYLRDKGITLLLDITHPYAATMSAIAAAASREQGIPCWRFQRPAWQPQSNDQWSEFNNWHELLPALDHKRSVFLTAGQLPAEALQAFEQRSACSNQQLWLRTAVAPKHQLAANMHWHKAIGPFALAAEIEFMQRAKIDALVTKNSGGDSTVAKLTAARELGVAVFMLRRPEPGAADKVFTDTETCQQRVQHFFSTQLNLGQ